MQTLVSHLSTNTKGLLCVFSPSAPLLPFDLLRPVFTSSVLYRPTDLHIASYFPHHPFPSITLPDLCVSPSASLPLFFTLHVISLFSPPCSASPHFSPVSSLRLPFASYCPTWVIFTCLYLLYLFVCPLSLPFPFIPPFHLLFSTYPTFPPLLSLYPSSRS